MQTRSTLLLVCRHLMYVLAIHIVISTCNLVMSFVSGINALLSHSLSLISPDVVYLILK